MTKEFEGGRMVNVPQSFRGYESPEQSFQGYADFILNNPRYGDVLGAGDLQGQIAAMGASGYATDPEYASKLASISSRFGGEVDPTQFSARSAPDTPQAVGRDARAALGLLDNGDGQMMPPRQGGLLSQEQPKPSGRQRVGDFLAEIAPTLGRMGVMGLEKPAQAALDARNARKQSEQQRNATAEWLRSQPGGEQFVGLIDAAGGAGALNAYMQSQQGQGQEPVRGISVGDRIVNPVTGEVIYQGDETPEIDAEGQSAIRKEFTSLPIVKSFADQSTAYGRVMASASDPSPAGDLALIFNFMKVLDPGSTVREGEFATAANAGGVDDRVRALYNSVTEGTRLAPTQRDDFANRATRLYANAEEQYKSVADQYAAFASNIGFDPAQILPDFTYSGDRYETPLALRPPPTPEGIDPASWQTAWANMSDEERRSFVNTGGQ